MPCTASTWFSMPNRLDRLRRAESTLAASSPQYDGIPAPATASKPAPRPMMLGAYRLQERRATDEVTDGARAALSVLVMPASTPIPPMPSAWDRMLGERCSRGRQLCELVHNCPDPVF